MHYIYELLLPVKKPGVITHTRVDTCLSIDSAVTQLRHFGTPPGWYIQVSNAQIPTQTLRYLRTESDIEGEYVSRERDIWLDKPKEAMNEVKPVDSNVKTAAAIGKPKLSDVPPVGLLALGAAMSDGAHKYGRFNWRSTEVTASVFYDAMMRHLLGWWSGEDHAEDSEVHHLGHLMAGAAIILDARMNGVFKDDRGCDHPILPEQGWWLKAKAKEPTEDKKPNFFEEVLDRGLVNARFEDRVAIAKAKLREPICTAQPPSKS